MKILLTIIIVSQLSLNASANIIYPLSTHYYVSATGSDANNGTSTLTPWKTLAKVNSVAFVAGDIISFNGGDTFNGALVITHSGSAGNLITYNSYGTGKAIITGFTTVTAWTNLGSNIWESTSAVSTLSTCYMVTINGVNVAMGRIPSTGYYPYQTYNSNISITSTSVNSATTNWTGAEAVIRKNNYTLDRTTITNHSGGTLTYTDLAGSDIAKNNYGFFIQNDARTLLYQNAWYYNPSTKKIRIYSTTSPTNVQVATISDVISNAGFDYITIDNLSLTGANHDLISFTSTTDNCTIQNCTLNFAGNDGIETIAGTSNLITLNTISNCGKAGIFKLGTNSTITSNTITNSGIVPGVSDNEAQGDGIFFNDLNVLVQYNTVRNSGSHGIYCSGPSWSVKNNFVDSSVTLLNDLGGIYTAANSGVNRLIDHNIVLNTIGNTSGTTSGNVAEGIYLDEVGSGHVVVSNNTVANSGNSGIKVHKSQFNKIRDNTVYNNTGYQIYLQNEDGTAPRIFSDTLRNNIFFSRTSTQWCLGFVSLTNDIASMGVSDSNYFARPIDDNITFQTYQTNTNYVNRTLATWKSFTGLDANSNKSPLTIASTADLRFEYNATASPVVIPLPYKYIDVRGIVYDGTITIPAYSSAVLIKNGAISNILPVADAGIDQSIAISTVTLSGSGTDGDGTIASYQWTKISGPSVGTIASPTSANTTCNGLLQGVHLFELKVTDNNGGIDTDTIQVTVTLNLVPFARAGSDQTINVTSTSVSGTASTDTDGTISNYSWTRISGPGTVTILTPSAVTTSVTGFALGTHVLRLTVTDNNGATNTDDLTVVVQASNTIIRNFIIHRHTYYK